MPVTAPPFQCVFNHDGFGLLEELADTPMTAADAERVLVAPLAESAVTALDWSILTTGQHNCRTRHRRAFAGEGQGRECDRRIGQVVQHFIAQPDDLLDVVLRAGHAAGLRVFAGLRLNHYLRPELLLSCPGRSSGNKKDFRDPAFHEYLCELIADLAARPVDGITLDFERKAPFFPDDAPLAERAAACLAFLRRARATTAKPLIARVAYDAAKGAAQGQAPEQWLAEGLLDVIVPATHNHEPDLLDWSCERFLTAAARSPRPCQVWPQIWPTPHAWSQNPANLHSPAAIRERVAALRRAGAHGVYFFNVCCFGSQAPVLQVFREFDGRA